MRKFYYITGIAAKFKDTHLAIPADHGFRGVSGGSSASETQMQDIRTNNGDVKVLHSVLIFDRRAAARAAAEVMTVEQGGSYVYSVREVGEFKRTVRPVLGYRLLVKSGGDYYPSAYNYEGTVEVDHAAQFGGDIDANRLFATRAQARKKQAYAKRVKCVIGKYTIQTVYADA